MDILSRTGTIQVGLLGAQPALKILLYLQIGLKRSGRIYKTRPAQGLILRSLDGIEGVGHSVISLTSVICKSVGLRILDSIEATCFAINSQLPSGAEKPTQRRYRIAYHIDIKRHNPHHQTL